MNIAVFTSAVNFEGEAKLINELFDSGMELLHLRKPEMDKKNYSMLLEQIDAKHHPQIALHAYHELAYDFSIIRLHYPEALRKTQEKGILRKQHPNKVLSTSIHSIDEIVLIQEFDYAFYGPMFDSYSKPNYLAIDKKNRSVIGKTNIPLFALGGMNVNNSANVKFLGFNGVGLLGWLWNNPANAVKNFKQIKCRLEENM